MRSFLLLPLLALSTTALAAPPTMTHQGRLFDALGAPLDGTHDLDFEVFTTGTGGTAAWSESLSGVGFDNGYYAVILGESSPADANLFAANDDLWLAISVDSGAALPRVPLTSVPYALNAATATQADSVLASSDLDVASVSVNGTTIIASDGTISYNTISGAPANSIDVNCTTAGDVALYDGSAWTCVNETQLTIAAANVTGTLQPAQINMGTTSGTVAYGDHSHPAGPAVAIGAPGTCDSSTAGSLAYGPPLQMCDGSSWLDVRLGGDDGLAPQFAAQSCNTLHTEFPSYPSGKYWLDPDGAGGSLPFEAWCDMDTDGGGWTVIWTQAGGARGGTLSNATLRTEAAAGNSAGTGAAAPHDVVFGSGVNADAWAAFVGVDGLEWNKRSTLWTGSNAVDNEQFIRLEFASNVAMADVFSTKSNSCTKIDGPITVVANGTDSMGQTDIVLTFPGSGPPWSSYGLANSGNSGNDTCLQNNANLINDSTGALLHRDDSTTASLNTIRHLFSYNDTATGRDSSRCHYSCWPASPSNYEGITWMVR